MTNSELTDILLTTYEQISNNGKFDKTKIIGLYCTFDYLSPDEHTNIIESMTKLEKTEEDLSSNDLRKILKNDLVDHFDHQLDQ